MEKLFVKVNEDRDRLRQSCRVCLARSGTIRIFDDSTIMAKMQMCSPIQIDQFDGLPECLCRKCSKDLDIAFEFYDKCIKSNERLQKAFQKDLKNKVEVKLEPKEELSTQIPSCRTTVVKREELSMSKNAIQALLASINAGSGLQITKALPQTNLEKDEEMPKIKNKKRRQREKLERNQNKTIHVEVKHKVIDINYDNFSTLQVADGSSGRCNDAAWQDSDDDCNKLKSKHKKERKSEEVIHMCDLCNISFSDKDNFEEHISAHKNVTYECELCNKTIKGTKRIEIHKKAHDNRMLPCEFCGKVYKKQQLQRHVASTHTKEHVECAKCGKTFSGKTNLMFHIKRIHHENGPETCNFCRKEYSSKLSLRFHIERVHMNKKPHVCAYCGHAFHSSKDKKEHENLHTGIKPFECPLCGKAFTQRCNMKSHFVHNHREYDFKLAMELYKNRKAERNGATPTSAADVVSELEENSRFTSAMFFAH